MPTKFEQRPLMNHTAHTPREVSDKQHEKEQESGLGVLTQETRRPVS